MLQIGELHVAVKGDALGVFHGGTGKTYAARCDDPETAAREFQELVWLLSTRYDDREQLLAELFGEPIQ